MQGSGQSTLASERFSPWSALAALLVGTFLGTITNSASNVALAYIAAEWHYSLDRAVWVVSLYPLTFAVLLPLGGYLVDRWGVRRVYLMGVRLLALGALGCTFAPSLPWLLAFRVLQGVGAAPLVPVVMAVTGHRIPYDQRGRATGYWALANSVGHAAGPPLSGLLIHYLNWRAVFFFGLPLGIVALVLARRLLPPDSPGETRPFDAAGAVALLALGLSTILAVQTGARAGGMSSATTVFLTVALASAVTLAIVERRATSPILQRHLLSNRALVASVAVLSAQFFCLFGLQLALPIYLIQGRGWTASTAGALVLALPLATALISPLAGRLADRWGIRPVCAAGMLLAAASVGASFLWKPSSPWWAIGLVLGALGASTGLAQSPAASSVALLVSPEELGVATGIFHMARFLSGSAGSTLFGVWMARAPTPAAGLRQNALIALCVFACAATAALGTPHRKSPRSRNSTTL
ncbi:MAG: MFS transporter [Chloroflexia bacterium]